jgi:transcriptional regulator with PAS, ATPase and Fis domain
MTTSNIEKTLWELLWEYDPNGLLVVDLDMTIRVVNPSLCDMFRTVPEKIVGRNAGDLRGDVKDLQEAWNENKVIRAKEMDYPQHDLHVREVIFPIKSHRLIACIVVDTSHEWKQREELLKIKNQTIQRVNEVVDQQMKVAQEIASLLGETTANTKVSLLQLLKTLEKE